MKKTKKRKIFSNRNKNLYDKTILIQKKLIFARQKIMKKNINIIKWTLIIVYLLLTSIFVSFRSSNLICSDIKVTVIDSLSNRFVTADEVKKMFLEAYPKIYGSTIGDMDFREMETDIEKHPAIQTCNIYSNAKGVINLKIKQYNPIVRVFSGSASFYLDKSGHKIPASTKFNVRTMVVNGAIPTNTDDLLNLASFIKNNQFWDAQIEQIHILRNNDYVLVPRVGEHLILIGNPTDFESKLRNLKAFYKQTSPKIWDEYKVINLKYKDQIVCSRKKEI